MRVQRHDISGVSYQESWDFQSILHNGIKKYKAQNLRDQTSDLQRSLLLNHIIFCEHNDVITLGKSASVGNLISTESELYENNIEVFNINRGGDITYHGPGQITGYLILDLELLYRDVHKYVRNIEECIIRLLWMYDIVGHRHEDYTGVWITDEMGSRKICAIGVHLSRWVSMHGFGFNINTDLSKFDNIIPCGIDENGMTVTSLAQELRSKVSMTKVKDQLHSVLEEVFGLSIIK